MAATQQDRNVELSSPLGTNVLLFYKMSLESELGRAYAARLVVLSERRDIEPKEVLGQAMTVRYEVENRQDRYVHGYASRFLEMGELGDYAAYEVVLRPRLWFLNRTADCKIFQEKSVPDIVKDVLRDNGLSQFEELLSRGYRKRTYCVQYRESDFDFVNRLMEEEGIYYYFKHDDGKHTLVLADSYSAHDAMAEYEEVPYYQPTSRERRERDHLSSWTCAYQVQSGEFVLDAFDFTKPRAELLTKNKLSNRHPMDDGEVFDYPGGYEEFTDGEHYVRTRMEEEAAGYERLEGSGNAVGLLSGYLFKLKNFPRAAQNREYLIIATVHELKVMQYETGSAADGVEYSVRLSAQDSQRPFRPPRLTERPRIAGPQTAIVVGPAGEEIYTDEYGRVKVQFHWDRYGESDDQSSCWIRVAQVWAGKEWGAMHIPRIGQEVIVEFLEGDPDRPIITGRVYNQDQMPPYELPANKTQSGLKSRSSKGGTAANFNEIRFEDKKGSEQMYIHAEKNQDTMVENDQTDTVGHDRTRDVGNDEKVNIGNNRDKTVAVNQTETIGSNKTISVGVNHTESIGSNMTLTVGSNKTETVAINTAETIGVAKELTIGGAYQVTVGAAMNVTVGAAKAEEVGANKAILVGNNMSTSVSKAYSVKAKTVLIDADDEITLKTGKATINMKKNGDITISGKTINIKGSGNIIIKGKKILEN